MSTAQGQNIYRDSTRAGEPQASWRKGTDHRGAVVGTGDTAARALASASSVEPGVAGSQALQQSGRRPGCAWEWGHGGTHGTTLDFGGPLPPVQCRGNRGRSWPSVLELQQAGPRPQRRGRGAPASLEGDPSTRTVVQQVGSHVTSCPMP